MNIKLTLGEQLKDLRVERHLKLETLAEQTGLSKSAIVENGKWKIKAGSIMGIVEDKGVTKKAKDIRQKSKNRQKREITRRC